MSFSLATVSSSVKKWWNGMANEEGEHHPLVRLGICAIGISASFGIIYIIEKSDKFVQYLPKGDKKDK